MRISQAVYRYVENELYYYPHTVEAIEELREDIISGVSGEKLAVQAGRTSNPTSAKATRLTLDVRLRHLERVRKSIEKVYSTLPPEKKKVVELKYWDRRLSDYGIYQSIPIARRTYFRWRNEIITAIATDLGLV